MTSTVKHPESKEVFFQRDGKWYFWDINFIEELGPYDSQHQAEEEYTFYMVEVYGI